ncbi:MAG: hypothetical protein WAW06_05800 [bacterium]
MRSLHKALGVAAVACCLAVTAWCGSAFATQDVIWGTGSAWYSTDPGFEGYWKYCLTLHWDVTRFDGKPHAMSHVSVLLGLENCPGVCSPGYFASPDTAGTGTGTNGCTVHYYMEFDCRGDPTLGISVPTIKFEPYYDNCEPDIAGTAYLCFYSVASPRPIGAYDATLGIKFGQNIALGTLEGVLPRCAPTTPVAPTTWGAIKAMLR